MIAAFDIGRFLARFAVKSGWVYYPAAGMLLAYLLYTMIRMRKGERPDAAIQEPEL